MKRNDTCSLPVLFKECFFLSLFTFGGGSAIIALLQKRFVEKLRWLDDDEMLEMITLAQAVPGATSVNTAMLLGYRLGGTEGAVVSAAATSLPPLLVIIAVTVFYKAITSSMLAANALRGVRACSAALVAAVAVRLLLYLFKAKDYFNIAIWGGAVLAASVLHLNALGIVAGCIVLGIVRVHLAKNTFLKRDHP